MFYTGQEDDQMKSVPTLGFVIQIPLLQFLFQLTIQRTFKWFKMQIMHQSKAWVIINHQTGKKWQVSLTLLQVSLIEGTGSRGREFWKLYSIGFLPENTFTNSYINRREKCEGRGNQKLRFSFQPETWGKVQTLWVDSTKRTKEHFIWHMLFIYIVSLTRHIWHA